MIGLIHMYMHTHNVQHVVCIWIYEFIRKYQRNIVFWLRFIIIIFVYNRCESSMKNYTFFSWWITKFFTLKVSPKNRNNSNFENKKKQYLHKQMWRCVRIMNISNILNISIQQQPTVHNVNLYALFFDERINKCFVK